MALLDGSRQSSATDSTFLSMFSPPCSPASASCSPLAPGLSFVTCFPPDSRPSSSQPFFFPTTSFSSLPSPPLPSPLLLSFPLSMFLLIPCSWSHLHSSVLNLILLFPVPYFLNSPGPFSFISPSSLVLFAALPSLLSSADLISVVDDPSLPDRRLRGGMGGSRQGRLYSSMCTGSWLWKSLFWLCGGDMFQTRLSLHIREKCPRSQILFWEKGEGVGNWIAQSPEFRLL